MKLFAVSVVLCLIAGSAVADDMDDALAALKQAEPSKDAAKIKQLAAAVHAAALKLEATPPTSPTRTRTTREPSMPRKSTATANMLCLLWRFSRRVPRHST
jgi:hypothetical protein